MKVTRAIHRLVLDTEYDELNKKEVAEELIKRLFKYGLIQVRKEYDQKYGETKYIAECPSIPEVEVMNIPINTENKENHTNAVPLIYEINHEDIENYINALPNIKDVLIGTRPYIHTVADFKNVPTEDFLKTEYKIPTPIIDWPKCGVYMLEDPECSDVDMEKLLTEEEGEPANENDN